MKDTVIVTLIAGGYELRGNRYGAEVQGNRIRLIDLQGGADEQIYDTDAGTAADAALRQGVDMLLFAEGTHL